MSHPRTSSWRAGVTLAAGLLLLSACGGGGAADADSSGDTGGERATAAGGAQGVSGEVVVLAAASLTEAFTELGTRFEAENPAADVTFSFAGSTTLATQLLNGAPADVYASANTAQMQRVVAAGLVAGRPLVFVSNRLTIVVPEGNPADVQGLKAFSEERLDLVVCAPEVPCGDLARQVFDIARVEPSVDSFARDVKGVLTKVALGEADAGLVYRTDVASASRPVTGISFPASQQAANDYPIAALEDAQNARGAQAFVDFVLSPQGQQILKSYGFTPQAA